VPNIPRTYTPPNSPSIIQYSHAFQEIVEKEFARGRYLGPFPPHLLEQYIGPFQSSPLSIIPKPGKPGKYRLIQNLSYPIVPRHDAAASINSRVDASLFPCTWGTFPTVCALIVSLPPGCQGATRDVAEAYRTIPIHPSQWPGLIVRLSDNPPTFAIDTALCFGYGPSAGVYGGVRDASLEIMRAEGIGPIIAWVDDHLFIRLPASQISEYNTVRNQKAEIIAQNGGTKTDHGRLWYKGETLANGDYEEFAEDCLHPLKAFEATSDHTSHNNAHAYSFEHIDAIANQLGIPWELSKDTPFSNSPTFMGFSWNLDNKTVGLTASKRQKYTTSIDEWLKKKTHNLEEVQKLHGRLSHAALTSPLHLSPPIPIPIHRSAIDLRAFSDASSTVGLAVVIGERWRAWKLHPDWKKDERDIGWAESVAFELLVRYLLIISPSPEPIRVFGDNEGVVRAWKKGRSNNRPTNETFRRIHSLLASPPRRIFAEYIPSEDNPADSPSRGIYPPPELALPPISIPDPIAHLVLDLDDPRSNN
ncbi:hypothetical protein M404DRAFT_57315, partial [Pisolithus tinctorius Marx 270]